MRSPTRMWNCFVKALPGVLLPVLAFAQPQGQLIDATIATVGQQMVMHSELVSRTEQLRQEGLAVNDSARCAMVEDILYEKLLLEQGRIDSVEVDEGRIQAELDRRIRYFVAQLGSEEKLEEFYGKGITEIKDDFHDQIRDQLLIQEMQQRITGGVRVTPKDVRRYFDAIPEADRPFINAEVEWAQIVRIPKPSPAEVSRVRRQLEEWRAQFTKGEKDFCAIATIYSDDPGSAADCGDLGWASPGMMVEAFDLAAMGLKDGEFSQVFETEFGWHLIQMVERRGQQYHARHILRRPVVGEAERGEQRAILDSLAKAVRAGSGFAPLAGQFSEDEDSRAMNGMMTDPNSNSFRWKINELSPDLFQVLDKLKPGEVSDPLVFILPNQTKALRVVYLVNRTEPHVVNLKDDYGMLQNAAEGEQRTRLVTEWLDERVKETYINIHADYRDCPFRNAWMPLTPQP